MSGVIMPGGWHYLQDGVEAPITAPTWEELPDAVSHFRVENGIPLGDVARDIEDQLCERYPHMCRPEGRIISKNVRVDRRASSKTPMTQLLDDVGAWLSGRLGRKEGLRLASRDVAERRAVICKDCPMMVRYGGCPDCVADVERKSAQVRMNQDNPFSRRIGGCKALRVDCRSAVFLERDVIEPSPKTEPPASCWYLRA